MIFSNEDHLRVTKVKTIDGVNPVYDDQNRTVKKIVHLPMTSKKLIEQQNEYLPTQIKMKVEVIRAYQEQPVKVVETAAVVTTEIEDLKAEIERLKSQQAPKKPMGRPKKVKLTPNEI